MDYKISVIIPVYNAEKTLTNAVDSILTQNWDGDFEKDIEIILVNDNSSDGSLDIIKKLSEKHDNISYYSFDDNSGFGGRGRNKGISLAKGRYIVLMDNDDIYLQDAFQTFYDTIKEAGSDMVCGNYKTDFLEERLYCPKGYDQDRTFNPHKNQKIFDIVMLMCSAAPWAKIYDKKFLNENNLKFIEDSQFDDIDFFLKCILTSEKITILPKTYVYLYYTYDSSLVRKHDKKHFDIRLKTMNDIDQLIEGHGLSSEAFSRFNTRELFLMIANAQGDRKTIFEMMKDVYDYEHKFGMFNFDEPELNLLNKFIMKKNFTVAFLISKFYALLYNNSFIKKVYRSRNNIKKQSRIDNVN